MPTKSEQIIEKDHQSYAPSGRIEYYPLVVDHGHGARIVDVDGKEYIDLLASAAALNLGATPERVVEAIKKQAEQLVHYIPAYTYQESAANLAEKLVSIVPGDFDKLATFGLSGSDANDGMMKFARAYTGRQKIITFSRAYHGATYGALAMSAISPTMNEKIGPGVAEVYHIPYPDQYRGMFGAEQSQTVDEYLSPLFELFETICPPETVAMINVETIQGDGGLLQPVPHYFERLREICNEYGIVLAVDDVQQGMGRTGTWTSPEHFGFEPDLIAFGKSLANGMPLSAIVGRKEIMLALKSPAHSFSAAGNPIACEASLALIKTIEDERILSETTRKGERVVERLRKSQKQYEFIGDVRGKGLSIGIDIVSDKEKKVRDHEVALKIANRAYDLGVLITVISDNVLRFQPPLVITDDELDRALTTLEQIFEELSLGKLENQVIYGQGW